MQGKRRYRTGAGLAALLSLLCAHHSTLAQDATAKQPSGRTAPVIVLDLADASARRPCEPGRGGDIVVCQRSDTKFRLPPQGFDPKGPVDSVLRERSRLLEGGENGIHSCNFIVGAGSWTGCELKAMERARQQGRSVSRFGDIRLGGH